MEQGYLIIIFTFLTKILQALKCINTYIINIKIKNLKTLIPIHDNIKKLLISNSNQIRTLFSLLSLEYSAEV